MGKSILSVCLNLSLSFFIIGICFSDYAFGFHSLVPFNVQKRNHQSVFYEEVLASRAKLLALSKQKILPISYIFVKGGKKAQINSSKEGVEELSNSFKEKIKVSIYLALWYVISVGYNIDTKKIFNIVPTPWTLMAFQLFIGFLYVSLLWLFKVRKIPNLDAKDLQTLTPVSFLNMLSLLTAGIGLGSGTVSFVHIVKSAEPLFTSLFGAAILGQFMAIPVYLSLLPVIFGVALASMKELSFSWTAMGGAMGSNLTSALRSILAKKTLSNKAMSEKELGGANLYAVLTVMGFFMLFPMALIVEGRVLREMWVAARTAGHSVKDILLPAVRSGLSLFWYYEVSFLALDKISPVTHAVANTMRRVFLVAASIVVFKTPVSAMNLCGSCVAIGGVFVYSLVKDHYDNKKK